MASRDVRPAAGRRPHVTRFGAACGGAIAYQITEPA